MFIDQTNPSTIIRSARSETCLQPASDPRCGAPAERETNCLASGYKHLAPAGAKSDGINSLLPN
jgi:hypothetical protein